MNGEPAWPDDIAIQVQSRFIQRAFRFWAALALTCLVIGNWIGWFVGKCSRNVLGTLVLTAGMYGFSLLICGGATRILWNDRKSKPVVLGFAMAMGTAGFIAIGGLLVFGSDYLSILTSQMCGVSFSGVLFYLGGIIWGIVVGSWRRRAFAQLDLM